MKKQIILIFTFCVFTISSYANEFNNSENNKTININNNLFHYSFYAGFGFGYINNSDVPKWTKERAKKYLTYLKDVSDKYDSSSVKSVDDPFNYLNGNLFVEGRIFSKYNFGLGIAGAYSKSSNVKFIGDKEVYDRFAYSTALISYCYGGTIYYKKYFSDLSSDFKIYSLMGLGVDYYYSKYKDEVRYTNLDNQPEAPYYHSFNDSYSGNGYGYHGNIEFGIETGYFVGLVSLYLPYAKIEEFKAGNKKMKFENGEKVEAEINGFLIQLGAGFIL